MLAGSMKANALLLGAFALVTTVLIAGTHLGTQERILEQQRAAEQRALLQIVPASEHNNSMLDDKVVLTDPDNLLGLRSPKPGYRARMSGKPVAVIIPATAPDGYSGEIDLLVGINANGNVAGVRVLNHRETPGLGDKVDIKKSVWITGFDGRSLDNPEPDLWKVKKDGGVFDQFTGATITPRAVTLAVFQALKYHEESQAAIWSPESEPQHERSNIDGDAEL